MEHMKYVHKDPNASGVPGKKLLSTVNAQILIYHFKFKYVVHQSTFNGTVTF